MQHLSKSLVGAVLLSLAIVLFSVTMPIFGQSTVNQSEQDEVWTPASIHGSLTEQSQSHQIHVPPENSRWYWTLLETLDNGNWEIYLHRENEEAEQKYLRLTNNNAIDIDARFNYGAEQIVFVSDRDSDVPGSNTEIYVMEADGSNPRRLTNNNVTDTKPDWSPDGAKIAYSSFVEHGLEIMVMNADGSNQRRLTFLAGDDTGATWSADGQQIAWTRRGINTAAIWMMNADGSNQREVVSQLPYLGGLRWSPDGRYLAFHYTVTRLLPNNKPYNSGVIARIDANGGNFREFSCNSVDPYEYRHVNAWTRNGRGIYYRRYQYDANFVLQEQRIDIAWSDENGNCAGTSYYEFSNLNDKSVTDEKWADPWPPQSTVRPLAPYTRLPYVILSAQGRDIGRSGLTYYDVAYRRERDATWQQLEGTQAAIAVLQPDASGWFAARVRAYDLAGNVESWSTAEQGDVQTILYRSQLSGQYTDQRNLPLAEQPIAITPFALEQGQSNGDGSYRIHTRGLDYTVNGTMQLTTEADWTRKLYHHPAASLLLNGDFEGALQNNNWNTSGTTLPQRIANSPYNGNHSLRMGPSCVGMCTPTQYPEFIPKCLPDVMPGCVDPDASFPPNWDLDTVQLFVGPEESLHFVGRTYIGDVVYRQGSPDGTWQAPEPLGSEMAWWTALEGDVQANNALHLVWDTQGGDLYYRNRSSNGTWSARQNIGRGMMPQITVDQTGIVHLLYAGDNPYPSNQQTLLYRQRSAAGVWSAPVELERYPYNYTSLSGLFYDIAVADNGEVQIAWGEPIGIEWAQAFQLVHRTRTVGGTWLGKTVLQQSAYHFDGIHLVVTGDLLNLLWRQDGSGYHAYRSTAQSWSEPEMIGPFTFVTADAANTLYVALAPFGGKDGYYRFKRPTDHWSDRIGYDWPTVYDVQQLDVDGGSAGRLHTVWDLQVGPIYQALQPISQTTQSALYQIITIPNDMHEPTLTFMYQLAGGANGASGLDVTVADSLTTTTVYTATTVTPWTLGWADLAAWQGETITVTFALHQVAGELPTRVELDDISLTSWQTALPETVVPDQIIPGAATTVIITGENFLQSPQVRLGEILLTGVERLDAQQLRVTIPATVPPGRYPLWVQNSADGPRTYRIQVQVGTPLYLPTVAR